MNALPIQMSAANIEVLLAHPCPFTTISWLHRDTLILNSSLLPRFKKCFNLCFDRNWRPALRLDKPFSCPESSGHLEFRGSALLPRLSRWAFLQG